MKITVLGAGAGGTATAFDCAAHGHEVRLFDVPEFPDNIERIADQGGIHAEGDIEGYAPIAAAGHDIDEALDGADLVFVVGPAWASTACPPRRSARSRAAGFGPTATRRRQLAAA